MKKFLKGNATSLLIGLLLAVSGLSAYFMINQTRQEIAHAGEAWNLTFQRYLDQINLYHSIRIEMGYYGFIHHFKNFVIRREMRYLESARQSMNRTRYFIERFQLINQDESIRHELQQLVGTIEQYEQKLQYLEDNRAVVVAQVISDLDPQVKVDDTPAVVALNNIYALLQEKVREANQETGLSLKMVESSFIHFSLVIFPALVISGLLIVLYFWRQAKKNHMSDAILQSFPEAVMVINQQGEIEQFNRQAMTLTGYAYEELRTLAIEQLVTGVDERKHQQYRKGLFQQLKNEPSDNLILSKVMNVTREREEFELRRRDGTCVPVRIRLTGISAKNESKVVATIVDLSMINHLKHIAQTDLLTSTHNKQTIGEVLQHELARAERYERSLAVIFVDIDDFKLINDCYGHQKGDLVLKEFAGFISRRLRKQDSIGRFGGEEFLIVCPETDLKEAKTLAESLRAAVNEKPVADLEKVSASFGITTLEPNDGRDALVNVIKRADDAMYLAKRSGKNCVKTISWDTPPLG